MESEDKKANVCEALDATLQRLYNLLASLPERLHLEQKMAVGKKFAAEHPLMTLFILVSLAMSSVPVMCFIAFACGSLFLTFTGFIFVEGFLLTIGGMMLAGILCLLGFLSLGLSALLALSWITFTSGSRLLAHARDTVQRSKASMSDKKQTPSRPNDVEILKDSGQEKKRE